MDTNARPSPCGFALMCLYYNNLQMHSSDFTRVSMYMSIACYGEIASGMFVLFLPVVPKFFAHLKEASSFSLLSGKRSQRGTLASGEQLRKAGRRGDEEGRKKSLWHISYTQGGKGSEERLKINVVSEVSVRSEWRVGEELEFEEVGQRERGGV